MLIAIISTDLIATILATYNILVAPLDWKIVDILWLYVIVWMLINDEIKVYVIRKIAIYN